jgi:hypothetical protein
MSALYIFGKVIGPELFQKDFAGNVSSGEASPNDCFVIFTWTREEGDGAGDPPSGERAKRSAMERGTPASACE